ncbi:MAG: LamG-like jellyroll fold domain-containing protein [Solirubrobacterales bacterium]
MDRKSWVFLSLLAVCLMGAAADAAGIIVKINFQLDTAAVPEGYLMDCGQVFADRGNGYSYGWSADATADDRERSVNADKRYDTFVHFSKNADKTWEIALPAGKYNLFFVCGDPSNSDQTNSLDVEGIAVTDPDGQDNFDEYTLDEVPVLDGRLTIKPQTSGLNAKICFIDITQVLPPNTALEPVPADGSADVVRDVAVSWTAAPSAGSHNVYLGTSLEDVNNATAADGSGILVSEGQADATYHPANVLAYGQTYYWRVDEVNTVDGVVSKGDVWSFTVEPFAYAIQNVTATASSAQADMGPENTVNGVGLDAQDQHSTEPKTMWLSAGTLPNWIQYEFDRVYQLHELWVWNSNQLIENIVGFGAKSVTIECSVDGIAWTEVADGTEFAQAEGSATYTHNTTVNLSGVSAKYVRLTIDATWSGLPQAGLSEVRFFYVPLQAFEPSPADAATDVLLDASLNWRPGRQAASHTVYLSDDVNAVTNATAASKTVADHGFTPATLNLGTTYYWRVDEINEAEVQEGEVWSFTTQQYAVVEDFESYDDDQNRIYDAWIDGIAAGDSGSTVGYMESPFAEQTIVHGGKQSMPLAYDNTSMAYSEATRTFETAQNWTANGVKSLSLYFQGASGNSGTLYVKINNAKVAYDGAAADIASPAWTPWNIDLSKVGGNLGKVTSLTIGIEGSGAKGILYVDDVRLYPRIPEYIVPVEPDATSLLALYAFEGNANDTSGNGLNGAVTSGQFVASGRTDGGSALQVSKLGYADLGNRAKLDFGTGDWTVSAWYKTAMVGTGDANKGTIYAKGGDSTGGKRYALIMSETTEGVVSLVTDDDVTKYVVDSKSVTNDDEWHCVVGQRQGASLKIYIDGQLEATGTATAAYDLSGTSQHNAYVGTITNHASGALYKLFSGLIDDVRVYNKSLSEGEILWLTGRTSPVAKPF